LLQAKFKAYPEPAKFINPLVPVKPNKHFKFEAEKFLVKANRHFTFGEKKAPVTAGY